MKQNERPSYSSPKARELEMRIRTVLCESPITTDGNGTEQLENSDTGSWF